MGAAEAEEHAGVDSRGDGGPTRSLALAADAVEVRRNARLLGAIGMPAAGVAVAYLDRALATGAVLDWALAAVMAVVSGAHLAGVVGARTPLMVADVHGVRIRTGRAWRGLTWGSLERVEHVPAGRVRDGRLVLVERHQDREPLVVPLGLSTTTSHRPEELTAALQELAAGSTLVVEPLAVLVEEPAVDESPVDEPPVEEGVVDEPAVEEPAVEEAGEDPAEEAPAEDSAEEEPARRGWRRLWRDPRPALAGTIERAAGHAPAPRRETVRGRRAEVTVGPPEQPRQQEQPAPDDTQPIPLEAGELRRPGSVSLVEDTHAWGERHRAERDRHGNGGTGIVGAGVDRSGKVSPIARVRPPVEPLVIDDFPIEPAADPVIGPELAAARTRIGLSVDQLAERTRIRPHVIESIEVDDFEACGGDFYARGHLRTLARVLGVDVAPLLVHFEERYSQAPIDPRRVFEAELASGGSIRGTRGGPNWSVLVAAVMTLVLAWSVARLIMDSPVELRSVPALNGSAGPGNGTRQAGPTVPVLLRAAGGGAHLVVRDGTGKVVFTGDIAYGQTKALEVSPPVRVESSDGSVEVVVDGSEKGAIGETGREATGTYVVR
jgi:helix-turn-helix protein